MSEQYSNSRVVMIAESYQPNSLHSEQSKKLSMQMLQVLVSTQQTVELKDKVVNKLRKLQLVYHSNTSNLKDHLKNLQ